MEQIHLPLSKKKFDYIVLLSFCIEVQFLNPVEDFRAIDLHELIAKQLVVFRYITITLQYSTVETRLKKESNFQCTIRMKPM